MTNAEMFALQNPHSAHALDPDDMATYAKHHAGGLVVLTRFLSGGRVVKMHDTWDAPDERGPIVVHEYDPDVDDDSTVTHFSDSAAAFAFFAGGDA